MVVVIALEASQLSGIGAELTPPVTGGALRVGRVKGAVAEAFVYFGLAGVLNGGAEAARCSTIGFTSSCEMRRANGLLICTVPIEVVAQAH